MPVVFGSLAATAVGGAPFQPLLFSLALLAMVALHSSANMLNDYGDYRRGLDVVATPVSGAIVRGLLPPQQVLRGGWILLLIGSVMGLALVWVRGWPLLAVGLLGVAGCVFYSLPPLSLKYRALGDLAVFLNFGVLGALGAWIVQTGRADWRPVVWSVPVALLVIGILHANNWRDIATDGARSVRTVAARLGDRGSLFYYGFLIFAPFVMVLLLVALHWRRPTNPFGMPAPFLLVLLALPLAVNRWRIARRRAQPVRPLDFVTLDGATAQLNLAFGLLCAAALVIHRLLASPGH